MANEDIQGFAETEKLLIMSLKLLPGQSKNELRKNLTKVMRWKDFDEAYNVLLHDKKVIIMKKTGKKYNHQIDGNFIKKFGDMIEELLSENSISEKLKKMGVK